jgi:hypothetical protein
MAWLWTFCLFSFAVKILAPSSTPSRAVIKTETGDEIASLFSRDLDNVDEAYPAMVNALEVMQSAFWNENTSTWPTGIDWTRAVINTHMSATLSMMAEYQASNYKTELEKYLNQVISFYDGENATALTQQKYDDQQWVILEWLEAIKFINLYSSINSTFDGNQYISEFAHRASSFWNISAQGYDTTLCGGGMLWTRDLAPYKNAITNQLFVASSIDMYLYYPGDNKTSPQDGKYLNAAIKEYEWLSTANLTNAQGLYVDGYHITNYTNATSIGTGKCDARDESVYTYNQGVLLSGLRGLWDATGQTSYLDDGYTLLESVIAATGWNQDGSKSSAWAGTCSQDAQNFKGIFFHHLTLFCLPLAMDTAQTSSVIFKATAAQAQDHQAKCATYLPWIEHNAQGAYATRNQNGLYGMWWDAPSSSTPKQPENASDYRNKGVPQNKVWRLSSDVDVSDDGMTPVANETKDDPNERGRGRTVETQSGGLEIVRCLMSAQEA